VIEQARADTPTAPGKIGDPRDQHRLRRAMAEADRECVVVEAREGVALRSLLTGLSVGEIAARMGAVVDAERAEIRRLLAER